MRKLSVPGDGGQKIQDPALLRKDEDGGLELIKRSLCADTERIVIEALIPVTRFRLHFDQESKKIVKEEVQPEHSWQCELLDEQGKGTGYSLEQCFDRVERTLLSNQAAELKKIIKLATGHENAEPEGLETTFIQQGFQHGIFKIDVKINEETLSFVATISRNPGFNKDLEEDHRMMTNLRRNEATHMGIDENSGKFDQSSAIPRHFGIYRSTAIHEPSFYIAPFIEGGIELNIKFDKEKHKGKEKGPIRRRALLNGQNQAVEARCMSEQETSRMMRAIAALLFKHAAINNVAFFTMMIGGDFLYDPTKNKIYWHTYRNPYVAIQFGAPPSIGWAIASLHDKAKLMGESGFMNQMYELLIHKEPSIDAENGKPGPRSYKSTIRETYSPEEVFAGIEDCLHSGIIDAEFLRRVIAQCEIINLRYPKEDFTRKLNQIFSRLKALIG